MSRAAAEVGATANSYQILAKLAAGGMAEIFLARGEGVAGVERYCVLKRILRERATDVHFVQMFIDEARLAAQLQHANIAQVYDIGKLGDSYFFTMEYVHGETVRSVVHRAQALKRQLPIPCVLTIAAGTAAGLHHAHTRLGRDGRALGIVHRDVSPSNLMVSYDGGVKLVDFGVAKAEDRSAETRTGTVKGKISYLSPEQCRGKRVDRRSDLFSLGICVWEMLTCERLYRRTTDFEHMNAIVTETPPLPSSRRAGISPALDALVMRLLAKAPGDRPQSADEVVDALEAIAAQEGALLSASALGRFVRELFGQRPEPWLELDGASEAEAVTVTSEPIPAALLAAASGRIDRQLAGVIDLSPPRQATESVEAIGEAEPPPAREPTSDLSQHDADAEVPGSGVAMAYEPTMQISRRHALGLPLAAPPPSDPAIQLPPPPVRARTANEPTHTLPSSELMSISSTSGVVAMGASGELVPTGTSGELIAPASAPAPSSSSARLPAPRRSRVIVALIGATAAVVAVTAVMIATRAAPGGSAASEIAPVVPVVKEAPRPSKITVSPIDPARPAAPSPAPTAAPPAPTATVESPSAAVESPSAAVESPSAEPPAPTAPPSPPAPPAEPPVASATAPAIAPSAASPRGARSAAKPLHDDAVVAAYRAGAYDKVVAQCLAGGVSAERTPLCFLAACHAGNAGQARKLFTAVPAARRDELITNCKQLGLDITGDKPGKPTPAIQPAPAAKVDCDADPMACQH